MAGFLTEILAKAAVMVVEALVARLVVQIFSAASGRGKGMAAGVA